MNRCGLLSFVLLLFGQPGAGQYQENLPRAKPIPPNAAALFKTLERPLGTYTGTIPISFPLCSVSSGALTADVSLNYTGTGGIKVEELSGSTALGFNLADGGGRITQMVKDKPDDEQYVGMLNNSVKPSMYNPLDGADREDYHMDLLDLEPDVYVYSFAGKSGKFFFKENGEVVTMQNDNIKIEWGSGWTITDERGNRYYFTQKIENTATYSSLHGSSSESVTSKSWYLTSAEDMNGKNKITYAYTTTGVLFTSFSGGYRALSTAGLSCSNFNTGTDNSTVTTDGSELLIARIDANSGYIIFNASPAYAFGPKRITSIEVYDSNAVYKKKYRFNYGTSYSSNRSLLANFSEFGSSGADSLTHTFEYHTPASLPTVLSSYMDIWGYYNGEALSLLPNITYYSPGTMVIIDYYGKRTANEGYTRTGVLKKITYPSGGSREFIYEGNKTLPSGNFFTYHPDPAFIAEQSFSETDFFNAGSFGPSLQKLFTINSSFNAAKFYYEPVNPFLCGSAMTVKVMKLSTPTDLSGGIQVYSMAGDGASSVNLLNGYYRLDVFISNSAPNCSIDGVDGNWQEGTAGTQTITTPYGQYLKQNRNAGGIRIKEIRDYDPLTNRTNKTEYRYKMYSTDSTMTSGLLATPVNIIGRENITSSLCSYLKLFPGSTYPLSSEGGSYVVYPEVRTIDSAKGWTDHLYTFQSDVIIDPLAFPLVPPEDLSFFRGKLLQEKLYDKNGTLLKKTINSWNFNAGASQLGVKTKVYWYTGGGYSETQVANNTMGDLAAYEDYVLQKRSVTLGVSIDSTFNTGSPGVSKTEYQYQAYNGDYFLKKKIDYINGRQKKEQSYKYVFTNNSDFKLGLTAGEQTMKTSLTGKHYLQPLEVVDSIRAAAGALAFQQGSKYIFGTFNGTQLHLSKLKIFQTTSDSTEINFTAYDTRGNLTEQYKTGDAKEAYLWGYRGLYPVAKVSGSTYAAVAALVDLSVLNNPASDVSMRTELNKIRAVLAGSKAQITTYTYSPRFGMTSMTDPAGRTTYYEYDLFGRLHLVRDNDSKVVKKMEYKWLTTLVF